MNEWLKSQSPDKNLESHIPKLMIKFSEEYQYSEAQIEILKEFIKSFKRQKLDIFSFENTNKQISTISKTKFKKLLHKLKKVLNGEIKNEEEKIILPRYKTILKNSNKKSIFDRTKFSISNKDMHKIKFNFAKRKKTKHRLKKDNNFAIPQGRVQRYSKEVTGNIALLPTILNAVFEGNYNLREQKFHIQKSNFLYPVCEQNEIYNIMIVLDTSKSISWIIPHIEKLISHITQSAFYSRDKVGLIAFNNNLAHIYHYPTNNIKQVIGTINKLEALGKTPLSNGLDLALKVLSKNSFKTPGYRNLIILISDCFPEPLEGGHKDLLEEPSYKAVIAVSEKIKKEKLGYIIINPAQQKNNKVYWNEKLIKRIKEISGARYIKVNPESKNPLINNVRSTINQEDLLKLSETILEVKSNIE